MCGDLPGGPPDNAIDPWSRKITRAARRAYATATEPAPTVREAAAGRSPHAEGDPVPPKRISK